MSTQETLDRISLMRALEALRNGVPNKDAVRALGCAQQQVLDKFEQQLREVGQSTTATVRGILVSGDFGAGKSHLLEYLQHTAISAGFVCSRVVISKETSLHDPCQSRPGGTSRSTVSRRPRLPDSRARESDRLSLARRRPICRLGDEGTSDACRDDLPPRAVPGP